MNFEKYSYYYDLLYKDKNYEAEADYVKTKLLQQKQNIKTILEFGSGTGRHAKLLAKRGFEMCGVERSQTMIEKARAEMENFGPLSTQFKQCNFC